MKVIITEKQLTKMLQKRKQVDVDEQETPQSPTGSENAAVNTPERPEGVPEMQKWESGVTRGVANPAGTVKKRHVDYPQSEPKRGKANPLR